jgi:hypothetical protein
VNGIQKFSDAVKKYLDKYGIPDDWSTLMLMLDSKDEEVVVEVIEAMHACCTERSPTERQGFKDKLEILSFTSSHSRVVSLAERVLKEL